MKKNVLIGIVLLCLSACYAGTEGLEYHPINDYECAVSVGNANLLAEIIIPNKYKNYKVSKILEKGFSDNGNLRKITIPKNINEIKKSAFHNCEKLSYISFDYKSEIKKIDEYVFSYCKSLKEINLPKTITEIGYYSFISCESLTSIDLPSELLTIDHHAFGGCKNLKYVIIPEGVTEIGMYAFRYCKNLQYVVIPKSVIKVGFLCFADCENLSIFCSAKEEPKGWAYNWEGYTSPVYWADEWEYVNGVPTPL